MNFSHVLRIPLSKHKIIMLLQLGNQRNVKPVWCVWITMLVMGSCYYIFNQPIEYKIDNQENSKYKLRIKHIKEEELYLCEKGDFDEFWWFECLGVVRGERERV